MILLTCDVFRWFLRSEVRQPLPTWDIICFHRTFVKTRHACLPQAWAGTGEFCTSVFSVSSVALSPLRLCDFARENVSLTTKSTKDTKTRQGLLEHMKEIVHN